MKIHYKCICEFYQSHLYSIPTVIYRIDQSQVTY